MLTCIACSKHEQQLEHQHQSEDEDFENSSNVSTPTTKHAIKALTAQIKDIALKASGAYRHCKPCSGSSEGSNANANANAHRQHHNSYAESDAAATDRFHGGGVSYRRTGSSSSTPRLWGKEMEARLKGISSSSGEATPTPTPSASATLMKSSRRAATDSSVVVLTQQQRQQEGEEEEEEEEVEEEPKEWVAQVEPGVLITFVSLPMPRGGNDLKRIRFSREMFNKWQAQRWWAENYDKVMELYNVQRFNQQAVPLPNAFRSEDESSKVESAEESPITPPLSKERLPRNFHRPLGMGYSSSDSLEHHPMQSRHYYDSMGLTSTPKLSSISGAKTETSSLDASIRTSSSREADRSGELSISNASDMETEWVEQDEPGVYITIRALPGNIRELKRVRFSREKFGEMHARLWWEENRARIHEQYL